ncbi:MAG: sterol desaturase family protein [Flavobacteriales bacterium]|nr:sterol desaturase family protein [Flavobacteriales bacterium]
MQSLPEIFASLDLKGLEEDPTVYFIPGFLGLILLEIYLGHRERRRIHKDLKDSAASIGMGIGSLIIDVGVKTAAFGIMMFLHQWAIFDLGPDKWYAWVLLLFADDLSFYWHHRLSHQVRILWAAHVNHHSSVNYNLAVALRQSWTEMFYKFIFWMWLPIVGFHPVMILTMISISLIYQFWVHTETIGKLGFLEWFMNTPSHHRVHHASNTRYLDRNHAGIFIIWDRLFGTFALETEQPRYGLTSNINTYNLFKIAFHEFGNIWKDVKRAPSLGDKLRYLVMPPGWSHDGSTLTSDQLREKEGLA